MRFSYGKIFLPGFGFFGISAIWASYNRCVLMSGMKRGAAAPRLRVDWSAG